MDTQTKTNLPANPPADQKILNAPPDEIRNYVMKRYEDSIAYYWKNGGINKRIYRRNRMLIIVLGALVTLLSSLISASFIENADPIVKTIFAIITPACAALLTIITGLTQSFQSGAAWRDMVLNAERLEKERDRFIATPNESKNYRRELNILNTTILNESTAFFKRILDSEYGPDDDQDDNDK